jgi:ABC-type uncharacterized transport system involved in gliding motility auxiliary subunit
MFSIIGSARTSAGISRPTDSSACRIRRRELQRIDSPLQICLRQEDRLQLRDRLSEYAYLSKQVSTEYVDPDKKPTVAAQNQVDKYGTILFKYKGRSERTTTDSEQDITTGIIKVVQGQQKKVYFTQGHGEKDATSSDRDGYKAIVDALTRENYTVDKVVLAQSGSVPDDAAVVVVAGPKTDFFPAEIEALKKYLAKSGKLLLEIDPSDKVDSPPMTNLIALSHDWGIDVGNDIVVDVSGMGQLIGTDQSVPVAASYPSHAITQRFKYLTAYPFARSVSPVRRRQRTRRRVSSRRARRAGPRPTSRDCRRRESTVQRGWRRQARAD